MTACRRRIVILGTGGTIAGVRSGADDTHYRPGALDIEDVLAAVPGLDELAEVDVEEMFQVDSVELDNAAMLTLARRVATLQRHDAVDAVVITHGTDTLEESAYLLHLVLDSHKPVVFVAAMRPSDSLSPDGPRNIQCAVAVAASDEAVGAGVLAVMNDEIHSARDASKAHTLNLAALQSPHGALGYIAGDQPLFYRATTRPHTVATAFHVDDLPELPRINILYGHPSMDAGVLDLLLSDGCSALVYAGLGAGNMSRAVEEILKDASRRGVHVVRACRSSTGPMLHNAAYDDDGNGWLTVNDQSPPKARLLLALGLTQTNDRAELQRMFWTY
jgi:glutamin-(asparagin-)ase